MLLRPRIQTALFALLATGCVTTHSPDDARATDAPLSFDVASSPDAFIPSDAQAVPDAFACPDNDRDGETDARCGGPDCDDADRNISSTRTRCASLTSVTQCAGAMRVDAACEGATPYCDARTNTCVADACGDRVMHANEQCDDVGLVSPRRCADCALICSSSDDCEADLVCRPVLSRELGWPISECSARIPGGAAFGARCAMDSTCSSGVCSVTDGRCTESAFGSEIGPCRGPRLWSEYIPIARNFEGGGMRIQPDSVCAFECEHNSECAVGGTCIPMQLNLGGGIQYFVAGCRVDWARGSVAQGGACAMEHDCASGVCVFGRCSQLCRDNGDCEAGAPNCVAADRGNPPVGSTDRWGGGMARPAEWGTPFPRVCLP
jgi:hypothetical protein